MIFNENVKKISNIKLIYFFPVLLAFLILYFFILQLLYIKTPMLFDIGYWNGLSTNFNPLLIEPNVLNSKSYFFTHFSPIFLLLQIIYYILPLKNPSLYFASWYTFLTILPLAISIYYVFIRNNKFNERENFNTIFFNLFIIVTLLITYFTQFREIYQFPHTEFIGIEYVCTGWLIICICKSNEGNNTYIKSCFSKNLSYLLIIFGSLFHELIALFGIASLITINLNKIKDIRHSLKSQRIINPFKNYIDFDKNYIRTIFLITSFIFLWVIFTNIIFKSDGQSALARIYLGSGDQFLTHLSLSYYLKNLYTLINLNKICFIYLTISYILISISDSKKLQYLFLPSLLIFFYISLSLISREVGSAAILKLHYSYPLIFTFYFVLYSIFIINGDIKFLKLIKKSFFKLSVMFIILFSFQIFRIKIPLKYEILTTDYKAFNNYDFRLMDLEERKKRPLIKKGNLLLNLYKLPKNISDLIKISNNSNKIFKDYYKKNNFNFNIIKKNKNLYLRQVENHNWNNLTKRKTYTYQGTILKNNQKSIIFFDNSEKKWIMIPINNDNINFDKNANQYLKNSNKFYLHNSHKIIRKNIDKESLKRFSENIKNQNLIFLISNDLYKNNLNEILMVQTGNYDIFLRIIIDDNGDISNLIYESKDQVIKYLKANEHNYLIENLESRLLELKNEKLKFNHNIYNNINFKYEDTKISKIQVKSILTKELRNKMDNSTLQRFKSNIENNDLLLLGSVDFNSDGLTEIYWREKRGNTFLKMKLNDSGDISDLSYQSKEELYNYLNKNDSKKLANNLISAFIFSNYKNQILDTETAALFPNISKSHLLVPYLFNENIKLKETSFVYWTLTPETNRYYQYIYKILSQSELKKKEYIQVGEYSGIPYYLRKYFYSPK